MSALLAASGVIAGYGKKEIVRGVDLAVGEGEVLLVLGHNGAGKTTLMRALFGLLPLRAGRVGFAGHDITGRPPRRQRRRRPRFRPARPRHLPDLERARQS